MRMRLAGLVLVVALAGGGAAAGDECVLQARRDANVDARGARVLRVKAEAGALRIEGQPGLGQVRVRGRACAARQEMLDRIQLVAERHGDTIEVTARIPEESWSWRDDGARLDLALEVPSSLALEVEDGSGSAEVHDVASLVMEDGSGELSIHDVAGAVRITDGSGDIDLRNVGGDVRLRDGSGGITARQVGALTVESDGSGSIDLHDVRGAVRVESDGSGSISVEGVAGDFVVAKDGSGGIHYADVRGRVQVPSRE